MKKTLLLSLMIPVAFAARAEEADSVAVHELDEVVAVGVRGQVKSRDGALAVDLPAIVRDKPVTNILEALGYVPGVVSDNGMIGLSGAQGVTIILNGEPTEMPVQNLYQLLYSMPVDHLECVEVMYAAPAKYHVSGAVINVVLKTPRAIDGLTGQARAAYSQAHYAGFGAGLAATYAVKNLSMEVNWTISRSKTRARQETFSNHNAGGVRTMIEDDMRQIGEGLSNSVYVSAAYRGLKASYTGQIKTDARNTSVSTGTTGDYVNRYSYFTPTCYHNAAVRYKAPFGLTAGGDFTRYVENRGQRLSKDGALTVNSTNSQAINRCHAYTDMEHGAGMWQINYGVEYQHSDDHSCQSYVVPPTQGFDDVLREDVAGFYAGVQMQGAGGLSLSVSAKAEYYHNDYRHSWDFVPQLGATYYKTPVSIFQLNVTSERIYPQYWAMHGATSYVNDYSSILGNPGLQHYMNYSGQVSYILRQKYVATAYLLYSDRYSVQLPYQLPDRMQLIFQTVNLDFSRTAGVQFNVPLSIGDVLSTTVVANLVHKREKTSRFHDIGFDNGRWTFYGALNSSLRPRPGSAVSMSVDVAYVAGQIQGPGRFNSLWKVDAGLKWQFGRKRCCELDVKCTDIFNTWNPTLTIDAAGQDYRLTSHDMMRNVQLTLVWRFNGFKPKDKAPDMSRFGTGD